MEKIEINKILEDKELFWKYILGNKCAYCKASGSKLESNSETLEDIQEGKAMSEQEKKIAMLKAKLNKRKNSNELLCSSDKCFNIEYADTDKIATKCNNILSDLKGNIDFWNKKGYNIYGYMRDNMYYISFEKGDKILEYNNMNEVFNKNTLINSEDIILLAEYLKIIK